MSAFVVEREHIVYLVQAAQRVGKYVPFSWDHGKRLSIDKEDLVRVANMLWQENIRSVQYRYDEAISLPGQPRNGDLRITEEDFKIRWPGLDAVQVLKSCNCYKYQTCEHPAWEQSEARAFINSLKDHAILHLPGYDEAVWGVPAGKRAVC